MMNSKRFIGLGQAVFRGQRGITGLETAIILIAFVVVASVFAFTVLSTGIFSAERGKETVHAGLTEARGSPVLKGSVMSYKAAIDDDGAAGGTTTDGVAYVKFVLTNATSGEPVDLTPRITLDGTGSGVACGDGDPGAGKACYGGKRYTVNTNNVTVINYIDENQRVADLHWEVSWLGKCQQSPCGSLLEETETALITAWLHPQRDLDATTAVDLRYVKDGQGGDPGGQHLGTLLGKKTQFALEVVPPRGSVILIERHTPPSLETVMNLK